MVAEREKKRDTRTIKEGCHNICEQPSFLRKKLVSLTDELLLCTFWTTTIYFKLMTRYFITGKIFIHKIHWAGSNLFRSPQSKQIK